MVGSIRLPPTKDAHALLSGTCQHIISHSRGDFADGVEVVELNIGGLLGSTPTVYNNLKSP